MGIPVKLKCQRIRLSGSISCRERVSEIVRVRRVQFSPALKNRLKLSCKGSPDTQVSTNSVEADSETCDLPLGTVVEFQEAAESTLPGLSYRYYSYKAGQGVTSREARRFLDSLRFKPRILRGLENVSTSTTILGQEVDSPLIIAPSAFHKFACAEGEAATSGAAGSANILYCYNWMLAQVGYEKVVQNPGPKWLHLYIAKDRAFVIRCLRQAEATGAFSAIIVTCDHPHSRARDYMIPDFRANRDKQPEALGRERKLANINIEDFENDSSLSWSDITWLKSITPLPIVVKGVMCVEDATLALSHGAAAVVVSNHGNRQLDGAPPAIEVLPEVVEAVGEHIEVYVDGGIQSGGDVIKALALGARGVLLGRPALWGLAQVSDLIVEAVQISDMYAASTQAEFTPSCSTPKMELQPFSWRTTFSQLNG
ncbi:hypothetical protein CYMTET_21415 [Cymbomonas tetramitiformis]|uniref:FMN hydroxy acid dehydrogenase domain-containing protein n=1 Tax=Cymbomonas tetramitiformis TaxID=36881 RepID=A0AAE0G276_9CHLO|nr:hypothetical protein CYMTET_21415 [Cymbomonas tetramitiformis]